MANYLGRNPAVGTQRMLDSIEPQFNGTLATFDLRYGGNPTYPTLSESLIVSLGGVLQEPGEAYYVSSDKIVFSEPPNAGAECWILLYSQYGAAASSAPALSLQSTGEPMGHEDRTHSSISFDNASRTFSIAPNTSDGHTSYVVWTKGTKRIVTESKSVQIGTSTGLYYIYFDAFGELQYRTTYFDWANDTPTAYVYWNATTSTGVFVADERHGIVLDWQTHEYLHRTRGAVIANGFSISNYTTTGDGDANSDAQFDLGNGTFFDEDLEVNITHSATPTVGTFTQVLTGNAEIPVYYMSGSEGDWVKDAATEFACKQSATTLQYNSLSGVTWSTPPATDNRYVVSWVVATNEINAPIIVILGQDQYSSIGSAEATAWGDLTLTNFPIVEFRPLWKIIFRTNSGYANTPNAYIANVLDLREFTSIGVSGSIVSDHGLLSGLADDDHAQYLNTTVDRVGVTANIVTTGNITAANLIATGQLQGPANFIIDPAAIGDDTGTVEIKGNLTVQGTTTTINSTTVDLDHLALGDNERFTIGDGGTGDNNVAGKDLEIYSDGSNLYFDSPYIYTGDQGVSPSIYFRTSKITTLDTNALTILNTGNIGLGTTTPTDKLSIRSAPNSLFIGGKDSTRGNHVFQLLADDAEGNGELRLYRYSGSGTHEKTIEIASQGSSYFNGGNIGIGTTNPTQKLHVIGKALITDDIQLTGSNPRIDFNSNGSSALRFWDITNNAERLRITSDGDILQTWKQDSFIGQRYEYTSTSYYGGLEIDMGSSRTIALVARSDDTRADILFKTGLNTAATEKMRIAASGNVGIGTTDPSYDLEVWGGVNTSSAAQGGGTTANIRVLDTSSIAANNGGTISFSYLWNDPPSELGNPPYIKAVKTSSATGNYGGGLAFGTRINGGSQVERMRILESGNVGIGTTNPAAKLDVDGNIYPTTDATRDLGSPTKRWANIYSADLQLSNEGSANEIDGTWGAYTIQEGEEALYLINRRSGKKFKFVLEEVKD